MRNFKSSDREAVTKNSRKRPLREGRGGKKKVEEGSKRKFLRRFAERRANTIIDAYGNFALWNLVPRATLFPAREDVLPRTCL